MLKACIFRRIHIYLKLDLYRLVFSYARCNLFIRIENKKIVYDNYTNVSHVDSIVTGGYYYRASVNIYVENGGSDSRFITTDPIFVKAS